MTHRSRTFRTRRGTILIVAMIATLAMSASIIVLCRTVRVESQAAANRAAGMQVDAIVRGAEQYVLALLAEEGESVMDLSEDQFAAVPVGDGYFWVLRPHYEDDPDLPVFGLVDEASKFNINYDDDLGNDYDEDDHVDRLMRLPNMTDDVAAAIMDWQDSNSTPLSRGAEDEYYVTLPEPYFAKNARFETVEELLQVRGVTRQMLYGDGTAPPLGERTFVTSGFVTDVQLARGWNDLLTCYSRESGGRIDITSGRDQTRLRRLMEEKLKSGRAQQILSALGNNRARSIFDLYFRGQMQPDELDLIANDITFDRSVRGLINVRTAPRAVMDCLVGLDSSDVEKLMSARRGQSPGTLAWIAQELGRSKATAISNFITTRTYQYSADILAVTGSGRVFKRVKMIIDTRSSTPRVYYRRDLTDRGWPMDQRVLASLRAGEGPGSAAIGMRSMGGRF